MDFFGTVDRRHDTVSEHQRMFAWIALRAAMRWSAWRGGEGAKSPASNPVAHRVANVRMALASCYDTCDQMLTGVSMTAFHQRMLFFERCARVVLTILADRQLLPVGLTLLTFLLL